MQALRQLKKILLAPFSLLITFAAHPKSKVYRHKAVGDDTLLNWFKIDKGENRVDLNRIRFEQYSVHDGVSSDITEKALKNEVNDTFLRTHIRGITAFPSNPNHSDEFLFVFFGNRDIFQRHYAYLLKLADRLDRKIVAFNNPGVGASSGLVINQDDITENLELAIRAFTKRIGLDLDKHDDRKKISLWGFSMGGAQARAIKHSIGSGVRVSTWNSFGYLSNVVGYAPKYFKIRLILIPFMASFYAVASIIAKQLIPNIVKQNSPMLLSRMIGLGPFMLALGALALLSKHYHFAKHLFSLSTLPILKLLRWNVGNGTADLSKWQDVEEIQAWNSKTDKWIPAEHTGTTHFMDDSKSGIFYHQGHHMAQASEAVFDFFEPKAKNGLRVTK